MSKYSPDTNLYLLNYLFNKTTTALYFKIISIISSIHMALTTTFDILISQDTNWSGLSSSIRSYPFLPNSSIS